MREITKSSPKLEIVPSNPRMWGRPTFEDEIDQLKEMEEQIKRHVDGVDSTKIIWDEEANCSFCGYPWRGPVEEDPGCCEEAEEEYKKTTQTLSHRSDCAVHNEPAFPNGTCNCQSSTSPQTY